MKTINVKSIAYHRNGVAGEGFNVVLFSSKEIMGNKNKARKCNFIATIFAGKGRVTVIDIDLAAAGNIEFGINSWRGDDFEPALRNAIAEYDKKRSAEFKAYNRAN